MRKGAIGEGENVTEQLSDEMDFVAIDFETANAFRGSPCAVAMVRYRAGAPTETLHTLMRPPHRHDSFDPWNMSVHGITPEDVSSAPRFVDFLPKMLEFLGSDVLVAHNAGFDVSVLRHATEASGVEWPSLRYACTLVMSRRTLDLPSYSLPWVAEELGVEVRNHHDPVDDALAAGNVLLALAERTGSSSIAGLLDSTRTSLGFVRPDGWKGSTAISERSTSGNTSKPHFPGPNESADTNHPLFGRRIVLTGRLGSMTRQEAWDALARIGGIAQPGINKSTDVLVVGPDLYQGDVLESDAMTGKMAKAARMREKGAAIEIMSEDEFVRSL